jgi:hypothetical protein
MGGGEGVGRERYARYVGICWEGAEERNLDALRLADLREPPSGPHRMSSSGLAAYPVAAGSGSGLRAPEVRGGRRALNGVALNGDAQGMSTAAPNDSKYSIARGQTNLTENNREIRYCSTFDELESSLGGVSAQLMRCL